MRKVLSKMQGQYFPYLSAYLSMALQNCLPAHLQGRKHASIYMYFSDYNVWVSSRLYVFRTIYLGHAMRKDALLANVDSESPCQPELPFTVRSGSHLSRN